MGTQLLSGGKYIHTIDTSTFYPKNKLFVESAFTGADPGAFYEASGVSDLLTPWKSSRMLAESLRI